MSNPGNLYLPVGGFCREGFSHSGCTLIFAGIRRGQLLKIHFDLFAPGTLRVFLQKLMPQAECFLGFSCPLLGQSQTEKSGFVVFLISSYRSIIDLRTLNASPTL